MKLAFMRGTAMDSSMPTGRLPGQRVSPSSDTIVNSTKEKLPIEPRWARKQRKLKKEQLA